MDSRKTVFLTGATGNMGREVVRRLRAKADSVRLRILVRPEERTLPFVRAIEKRGDIEIVWGDLAEPADVARGVRGADVVLHVGALVSPLSDRLPKDVVTRVNVGSARNIVEAIKAEPDPDRVRLVYIGTVAQTGSRNPPVHWGRTGDPIKISRYDHYAVTKTQAEAIVAESGLRHWVSIRQTGMAHLDMWKIFDPIMFHNPVGGVFEWTTANDSGRLMAAMCGDAVPDSIWRRFFNIGGGEASRVTNHDFMVRSMAALGVRDFRDVLRPHWLATRNFHGQWYSDSDALEALVPYREQTIGEFFDQLGKAIPAAVRLFARFAPGMISKRIEKLANAPDGTLYWIAHDDRAHIDAHFGSRAEWERLPKSWDGVTFAEPSRTPTTLDHGYDEAKAPDEWSRDDLAEAARFRGGALWRGGGDAYAPSGWTCALGHDFEMSANLMLRGGHWCPTCQHDPASYAQVAARSPFFAQVTDA